MAQEVAERLAGKIVLAGEPAVPHELLDLPVELARTEPLRSVHR